MPSLLEILLVLLGFLPQVFLLYLFLTIIEKSGLLSMLARVLHLPVKNLLPVCLGFGCTTLAVCSAKDNPSKNKLSYFLSFLPCTAQIPLIMLLLVTVLRFPVWSVLLVYLSCIVVGLIVIAMLPKQKNPVLEERHYKLKFPNLWACLKESFIQTLIFSKKIFIAFIVSAFVIIILARFSFEFKFVTDAKDSILFSICGILSPVFNPIGLGNPAIVCALIFGVIAKESAVSVLLFFPDILSTLTFPVALSLLIFYTFYPKCISAQTAISNHCGAKTCRNVFLLNLLVAYVLSFVVYTLCG